VTPRILAPGILDFLRADKKKDGEKPAAEIKEHIKPGQSREFKSQVLKCKLEVIEAIKNADKRRALDSLMILSNLAAHAIYEHDMRAMLMINTTVEEINQHIDAKLKATGEPDDLAGDVEETKMYLMIRLSLLPVSSMMNALQSFSSSAMNEVNSDIESRIGQIRQFVMDHEKS
jgi:hypothetical protein